MAYDIDALRGDSIGTTGNNHYTEILIMGQDLITFVSRDGQILASAEIPHIPISKPIIADFDNDGVNDLLILTDEALLGYRMEAIASVRSLLIAFFILATIAIVVFIFSIRDSSSTTVNRISNTIISRFATKRSTDERFHMD